jgi:uncharacterized protein
MFAMHPWLLSLIGGVLIGLAAVTLMASLGRIAGISGIAAGALNAVRGDRGWRLAFVAGLVIGPWLASLGGLRDSLGPPLVSWPWMALAGLLVGLGTRLGSGCTSGHGVCGIARLSPRSLAATGAFMAAGVATVFIVRHLLGAVGS